MKVSIAILTFCSLSFILVVILNSLALDKSVTVNNIVKSVVDPDTETLPASYLVPHTARTPAKNQGSRGTCWIFSTMGILEGLYRKNGYEKGFLKEDEYVSFSEQACKNFFLFFIFILFYLLLKMVLVWLIIA